MKVILIILLLAVTAQAQTKFEKVAHIALWSAQSADTVSTIYATTRKDRDIREANRALTVFGNRPAPVAIVGLTGTVLADTLSHYKLRGHPTNKIFIFLIGAGEHSVFAIMNMHLARKRY